MFEKMEREKRAEYLELTNYKTKLQLKVIRRRNVLTDEPAGVSQ